MVLPAPSATPAPDSRLLFLDALRAFASLLIVWHHFALYPPLSTQAEPILGPVIDWFRNHARATQVFFVVGGFVMARSMSARSWDLGRVGTYVIQRYYRLGIPYLVAIAVAIAACAFARGWLAESVTGAVPTFPQLLAHLFFLQDLLGYEQLSAGLWFVCINFQLSLIYVAALYLQSALTRRLGSPPRSSFHSLCTNVPILLGWALSAASLFYFNLDPRWDSTAFYFYPYFFMGTMVHHGLRDARSQWMLWLYFALIVVGMCYDWRWRLASALVVGALLFGAEKSGIGSRWPKSRAVARLGRVSYSLFLIHFPVLVVVSGLWVWLGWDTPAASVAGLLVAFTASVASAFGFYRLVEAPAGKLSRRWSVPGT